MRNRPKGRLVIALLSAAFLGTAVAGDSAAAGSVKLNGVHSEILGSGVVQSHAMRAMLRADRNKDGVLSRGELEQYDLGLARRFKEADADRDGKLNFSEFEKLFATPETSVSR